MRSIEDLGFFGLNSLISRCQRNLAARSMAHGQLARDVGVTRACVSTWVRGISLPTGERAAAVERLVGVAVAVTR